MKIAFDAKRAFYNSSGLGNYSRNTILLLEKYFNQNEYYLVTPSIKKTDLFNYNKDFKVIIPSYLNRKFFKRFWRSYLIVSELQKQNIEIYHGLSNELPVNINKSKAKSIVTIHDLIFLRYPQLYKSHDRYIYKNKFRYSCNVADRIIAVSEQTKEDIIKYFNINKEKIDVVYQGCNSLFYNKIESQAKENIRNKYKLPLKYLLYVGTVEERKNLFLIIKALKEGKIDIPLVVAGKSTKYIDLIKKYISEHNLKDQVFFYHNVYFDDLPCFYQLAEMLIYPSIYEGFGIPILEALVSKTPVITSTGSCFKETGGNSTIYIDPNSIDNLIEAINKILSDNDLKNKMIVDGYEHAKKFSDDKIAENIMAVYKKVMN